MVAVMRKASDENADDDNDRSKAKTQHDTRELEVQHTSNVRREVEMSQDVNPMRDSMNGRGKGRDDETGGFDWSFHDIPKVSKDWIRAKEIFHLFSP
jgi:hypothetical protein